MDIRTILRRIIVVGIFTLPFVPLIVSSSLFFPFITAKNIVFRMLVEIIFASWIVLAILDRSYRPSLKNPFLISVLVFLGIIGIADMAGMNPFKSFWSNFERMEGYITLLHLGAYFVVLGNFLKSERLWKYLFATSVGVSVIVAFIGVAQLSGAVQINQSGTRLDANLGNATYAAIYMLLHIFITAFLLLRYFKAPWMRYAGMAIIALQILILFNTGTRGAAIGFVVGILFAAGIALFQKNNLRMRKIAIGVMVGVAVCIGGLFLARNTEVVQQNPILSRFATLSLTESTTKARFLVWNKAWQGFKERPIFGWGQENFNYVFNKYYDPQMYAQEQWFDRTHNVILDWLIAGGIVGLISYLSLFAVALYYLWRRFDQFSRMEKGVLTGALIGYFIHNLFVFDNITSYLLFFTIFGFLYAHSNTKTEVVLTPLSIHEDSRRAYIASAVALVLLAVVMYNAAIVPYKQARTLILAISSQEGIEKNLEYFKEALAHNSAGTYEAREQLLMITPQIITSQSINSDVKSAFVDLSKKEAELQLEETPLDARYHLFYGSFLSRIGEYDKAATYLDQALELSPNKQSILYEIASNHLSNKQNDKALEATKRAFELAESNMYARITYAFVAMYINQKDLARHIVDEIDVNSIAGVDDRLLNIYVALGEYDKVLTLWRIKVEEEPENTQHRLSLAAAYLKVGDRENAIAEIERAMTLNPQFKSQGEYLIKEIRAGRDPSAR